MLSITTARPLRDVHASAFGRSFPCFPASSPLRWSGLVGIDLDTIPGPYTVVVSGVDAAGLTASVEHPLEVAAKAFATRRLTVDAKFVTPPPEALARIQDESVRVRAIVETTSPERHWSGPFTRPVPGRAISEFGKRSVYNGEPRSPHSGTDFAGAVGTRIRAPNAGRVVLAAELYYSGNTVILDHGQGLYSHFGHLSAFSVAEGDLVPARAVVGRIGATGVVTGPHLHWSVRLAGARVDPLSLLAVLTPRK
jgi:murein DD-endopeptidase MepM/ murein hydrolase activator NlpD